MDLILWRHADAGEPLSAGGDDLARELTARGQRHAQRMAEWINRQLPDSARILVSPAARARQTADALGRKYRVAEALAPDGSVDRLLVAARWPTAREPVLVVGHQPALGATAALLLGGRTSGDASAWSIRKGGVWWLRHRDRRGAAEVILLAALTPELLQRGSAEAPWMRRLGSGPDCDSRGARYARRSTACISSDLTASESNAQAARKSIAPGQ